MPKYAKTGMSTGKKVLMVLGIIILLVLLFLASFWITSYTLKTNQEPDAIVSVSATPKPSYEELEKIVIEKNEKIAELEANLEAFQRAAKTTTAAATSKTTAGVTTTAPKSTVSTPKPTAKATVAPTAAPTVAPTKAPTKAPVAQPTEKPAVAPTKEPSTEVSAPQAPNTAE